MKKIIYLIAFFALFSCQNSKDNDIESQLRGLEVNNQSKTSVLGKPPVDNPLFVELLNFKEVDLNRVDKLYIKSINEAKGQEYLDNLKQFGFHLIMRHGLLETGTAEQKQYYINEQLNSQANFANILDFYSLIMSGKNNLSGTELKNIENLFFSKNYKLINSLNWTDLKTKGELLRQLNYRHMLFGRYLSSFKNN
jgi:hypothetical protein